jgi:hypothetical protein
MTEKKGGPPQARRPKIYLPKDQEPTYANLVRISHTAAEVIMDYARFFPGDVNAKVVSRVVVSPLSAKLLLRALSENLAKYESQFGEVEIPQKQTLADFLFKPPSKDDDTEE